MPREAGPQFDFNAWSELAARDPEAFERRRSEVIEDFIRRAPEDRQERLRRLQWRIDRTRERAGNPVAACVRLSQMMWDSLAGDGGLLEALDELRGVPRPPRRPPRRADVVAFRTRH